MIDMEKIYSKLEKYADIKEVTIIMDNVEKFQYLIKMKNMVPEDIYAFYLRVTYQTDVWRVPLNILLQAFEGVDKRYFMYEEEIEEYEKLPEYINIFRGTEVSENTPRLSWSLDKKVAMRFYNGRIFKARIKKEDIFGYLMHNGDEKEIVAYVPRGYQIEN